MKIENTLEIIKDIKNSGKTIVFTNGCFDILHRGHIEYLKKAKEFGDILVVGLNSDESISRIKGPSRPINCQEDRYEVLLSLKYVDFVIIFNEDTPEKLIELIVPDVLTKGSDWKVQDIVGAGFVIAHGGKVITIEYLKGKSTSSIISRILAIYGD